MHPLGRITIHPGRRCGKPCIRSTHITVGDVLGWLAAGMKEEQVLKEFPQLTHEDILACFAFSADRDRNLALATARVCRVARVMQPYLEMLP